MEAKKNGMNTKAIFFIVLALIPLSALLTQCWNKDQLDRRDAIFAGSVKCVQCYKDIYNSYIHTTHYQTSRPASAHSIHGSFAANQNTYVFNADLKVKMEERDGNFFQVAYLNGKEQEAHRFDITFGIKKAETYMYWDGNELFQLPISYFNSLHSWDNSPGYTANYADFSRPILRRCFECHSSYIKELPQADVNMQQRKVELDSTSLIYGIDCERCHGAATNHVNYHLAYPQEKKAKYITTYTSLSRGQKLDACAVCHGSGKDEFQVTAFKFKMGDNLAKFKEPNFAPQNPNPVTLDVHGNQNGLLAVSKCFLMSNIECGTCHNPHRAETQNLTAYSEKCMQCHSEANHNFCKLAPKLGGLIKNNCIDCHMPSKPSNVISVAAAGGKKEVPYSVRTHYIAIYPAESQKIMAAIGHIK